MPGSVAPRQGMALFSAGSASELVVRLRRGQKGSDGGFARAAVLDPTPERIARAVAIAERGRPWRGRDGIWFSPLGLLSSGGKVAFLFPGVDVSFEPRVDDVARHFSLPVPPCTTPQNLQEVAIGIIGVNRMFDRVLRAIGVEPSDTAGHSIGEWSGMIATGIVPDEAADRLIASLGPGSMNVPGVVFATAGCGVERVMGALEGLDEIALSHDNCPHQVLVCGIDASVERAIERLRQDGVVCQKLPFQSGFHSPLFADYIGPHRENFARLPIASPRSTLWSATTCAPYPEDPEAIRELAILHLVHPVRFRELVELLHAEGTRVFLQAGAGSLVHFVEDTLRGRPHLAVAANVKERPGMDQLARVAAALFVEGAKLDLDRVLPREVAPARGENHPLVVEFTESMTAIAEAERDVMARFAALTDRTPRETTTICKLSIETLPELLDHTFVRQPEGWPTLSDRQPVVPMTMLIHLMMEHAADLCPGRVPIEVEQIRAHRWLIVAPPVDAKVSCHREDGHRIRVVIDDYCEGTVVFSDGYPAAPKTDPLVLAGRALVPVPARALYEERWLFHGPAFQGVVDVGWLGEGGIRGTLAAGSARGALLDNAGQLFGYWVMAHHEVDRMAMPVRLSRVRFFGPHPQEGERLECTVRVRSLDERSVVGDLTLARDGKVWAVVEGWENRRFETDERLWALIQWPEKNMLSEVQREGFVLFDDHYRAATTRDRLARRFLGERERAAYESQTPRRQRSWLAGRIAAKDAVRNLLWKRGSGPIFPVEVGIENEPSGRPIVRTAKARHVNVSIAHKEEVAVAMAGIDRPVGIDIERIQARTDSFVELSFSKDELCLVEGEPRDEGLTRLWSAKEAAAKAAGTGLGGVPARFPVRDRAGERLLVGNTWVSTKRHQDFIIGWTSA